MARLSLTRTLCITGALVLASCGEAKVAAKIKPEEVELAGTIVSRSIKGCAKEGWEVCLFLTKIFFPEAAEIGGKVPRAGQRFEQFCDTNPGLRQEMVDGGSRVQLSTLFRVAEPGAVGFASMAEHISQ